MSERIQNLIHAGTSGEIRQFIYDEECLGLPYEVDSDQPVVLVEVPVVEADLLDLAPEYKPKSTDFKLKRAFFLVEPESEKPLIAFIQGDYIDKSQSSGPANKGAITCLLNLHGKKATLNSRKQQELLNFDHFPWPGYHPVQHLQKFQQGRETIFIENRETEVIITVLNILGSVVDS